MSVSVKHMVCDALYTDLKAMISENTFPGITKQSFLITGGNGFIASYLVYALLCLNDEEKRDNHITILVRSEEKARQKYGALLNRADIDLIVQDVCDPIDASAYDFDYIIHAASSANAQHFDADPIGVFNSNVVGTERMIDYLRCGKTKSMVYISSFTVYGNTANSGESISEDYRGIDDWSDNRSCYSLGKRASEFLCMAAQRKYQCPIRIVRPGFVYGASTPDDMRVYAEIIRKVAEHNPITLRSAGLVFRSMIYVTDVVRGIFCTLFSGTDGEAYNIANEFVSIRAFAEAAATAAASDKVQLHFSDPQDEKAVVKDRPNGAMATEKLRACGWTPAVSLTNGIAMAAKIYRTSYLAE